MSDDQENDEDLPVSRPAESLPPLAEGDVVGSLTVLRKAGKNPAGAVLWECSCSCGKAVLRAQWTLTHAKKLGRKSACRSCRYADHRWYRDRWRVEIFLRAWESYGSLYSDSWGDTQLHYLREESDLLEPVDLPDAPFTKDDGGEADKAWPLYPDTEEGMTLEEIGKVLGITRERVRQIEWGALRKLHREFAKLDADTENKMHHEYLVRHGFIPLPKRHKPIQFHKTSVEPEVTVKTDRDKMGVPEGCLLLKEAAEALGWPKHTFANRAKTSGMTAAGMVPGPTGGKPWGYWALEQMESLAERYKGQLTPEPKPKRPRQPRRRPRRIVEVTTAPVDGSEAFPVLLVVRAKISGISMTIPCFVQGMARAADGNHQVKIKFNGQTKDSILDTTLIVWAKDLLTMDYSPYKTPWD